MTADRAYGLPHSTIRALCGALDLLPMGTPVPGQPPGVTIRQLVNHVEQEVARQQQQQAMRAALRSGVDSTPAAPESLAEVFGVQQANGSGGHADSEGGS